MKKIGFYGGTFDPFHLGHLCLCYTALESGCVDSVLIVPNSQSPLKQPPMASFFNRLAMCQLACHGHPELHVLSIERSFPSYTIDTLTQLQPSYPEDQLILLIGADQMQDFHRWKDAARLQAQFSPTAFLRSGIEPLKGLNYKPMLQLEISSTLVRERLNHRLPVDHLLPAKVIDYIMAHHLYF